MEKRVEDLFCFVINISNECVLKYLPYLDVVRAQTFNPKNQKLKKNSLTEVESRTVEGAQQVPLDIGPIIKLF